jgi:hypothetical protein
VRAREQCANNDHGMKLRWWLERSAIVAGVIATMATSKPRGLLDADLPPHDTSKARVLVVEASEQPELVVAAGGDSRHLHPATTGPWKGSGRYFVPAGSSIVRLSIDVPCRGGCFFKKCEPTTGQFVRVTAIEPAHGWTLDARSPSITTKITPTMGTRSRFELTAPPDRQARIEVSGTTRAIAYSDGAYVYVDWYTGDQPATETWSVRAVIEGPCPDAAPCEPPPGVTLELGPEEIVAR